jgi:copper chaperone NosL
VIRPLLALVLGLGLFAMGACENADAPLEPAWGKTACGSCSMLVSDKRFAAELVTSRGDHLFFDDPGCLASYLAAHSERARHAWVRTGTGSWIDAQSARFKAGAKTPMDYGFEVASDGSDDWSNVETAARTRLASKGEP